MWLGASALSWASNPETTRTISIFHTTDLHGNIVPTKNYQNVPNLGGIARCATCIEQWRQENPHSLLIDCGDVYQGTVVSTASKGNLFMQLFNHMKYDAWVLGNHDLDWGPEATEKNLSLSDSDILTANLTVDGVPSGQLQGAWSKVKPWAMKEVGGFKIALIGLITPGLPYWLADAILGKASATDPLESLKKSLSEAKAAGADAILLLGHMGFRKEDDFANRVFECLRETQGIDAYIGGHTHQDQPSWDCHGVLCSQANYFGIHCGRIDLTFDLTTRKIVARHAATMLMDERFELHPEIMKMTESARNEADASLASVVGQVREPIAGSGRNSPLAQLFCRLFLESLAEEGIAADAAFHGTFDSGDLKVGPVTMADCWKMMPFDNFLTVFSVTPAQLIEIIQEDLAGGRSDRSLWPLTLVLDPEGNPAKVLKDGKPLADDARIRLAMNSYDAQSGGKRLMKLRDLVRSPQAERVTNQTSTLDALAAGFRRHESLP